MAKILHHRAKCIGCGACAAVCDKFFKMAEDGLSDLIGGQYDKDKKEGELAVQDSDCAKEAVAGCPVQAIEVK